MKASRMLKQAAFGGKKQQGDNVREYNKTGHLKHMEKCDTMNQFKFGKNPIWIFHDKAKRCISLNNSFFKY